MVTVLHTPPIFEMKRAMAQERKIGKMNYVSVSKPNAEAWRPYLNDCAVINNGIDTTAWKFHEEPKGNYVAWFGRIHPDKGTHIAIEAAKLAGYKIKVAGSIADRHYYETYVEPFVDESVELLGNCSHEELNDLIGNALCCLITPSWEEPFGLVVAESLACGTPVAGISRGALPHILTLETGCLTSSNDPAELAQCIDNAIKLDRTACRKRAELTLDVEHMVNAYEELFSATISTLV
jgi:glycosyltransferase involved in cell wall biosynthesis